MLNDMHVVLEDEADLRYAQDLVRSAMGHVSRAHLEIVHAPEQSAADTRDIEDVVRASAKVIGRFCGRFGQIAYISWRAPGSLPSPVATCGNSRIMFIAHAPSGYILSVTLLKRARERPASVATTIAAGMVGAIAPDFDWFYFYFVDHRQTHHHKYFSHWPLCWLLLAAGSALWLRCARGSRAAFLTLVFSLGGILHVILDSVVGDVWWFAPFIDERFSLFHLHARFKPWWLNLFLHWTFALELAICAWAYYLYRRRQDDERRRGARPEID